MVRTLLFFTVVSVAVFSREKVVMFPCMQNHVSLFFNEQHRNPCIYVWPKIIKKLAARNVDLIITETNRIKKNLAEDPEVKYFIFHNHFNTRLHLLNNIPKTKAILWIWEPATVVPIAYSKALHQKFSKVFTFDDSLLEDEGYLKYYHPHNLPMIEDVRSFKEKKFLCLMNANKKAKPRKIWLDYYAERRKVIDFYEKEKPGELHLFGKGWGKCKSAKGFIGNKLNVLKNYRFCICYENTNTPGYVTEKIFDCFHAGVVPVYLGAKNVTETIPEKCFINRRRFNSDEAVYQYMKAMDEETYKEYLQNIRDYLASEQGYVYTPEHFIESFVNWVLK